MKVNEDLMQLTYNHQLLDDNQKLDGIIARGPSRNQIVNVIFSRQATKQTLEYVTSLDDKWVSLEMMSHVYLIDPEIKA